MYVFDVIGCVNTGGPRHQFLLFARLCRSIDYLPYICSNRVRHDNPKHCVCVYVCMYVFSSLDHRSNIYIFNIFRDGLTAALAAVVKEAKNHAKHILLDS
jgi:hypothetical protein